MKLKHYKKRWLKITTLLILLFTCTSALFCVYQYRIYTQNNNLKMSQIISILQEKYPEVTDLEVIEILNNTEAGNYEGLLKFGIDPNKDSLVLKNEESFKLFLGITVFLNITMFGILLCYFLTYEKNKDKRIHDITRYIEEINKHNYEIDMEENEEDELSILKNEVYKTTIMLKESSENSLLDKINLKNSLSDISHQLKTPLTSMMIMLDAIIDDSDMDETIKKEFIQDIKREIMNMNFLIQSLLKLSKFDANVIHFMTEQVKVKDIICTSLKNVAALCDLKNIKVLVNGDERDTIQCDFKWQVEAITNIVKNCVEHSFDDSVIEISYGNEKIYSYIVIEDHGTGISKEELKHIFERFYKGKHSSKDSVGIGLSLAKKIIEQNNGTISVESKVHKGTRFTIKYF